MFPRPKMHRTGAFTKVDSTNPGAESTVKTTICMHKPVFQVKNLIKPLTHRQNNKCLLNTTFVA
jgi:hypothetical protein